MSQTIIFFNDIFVDMVEIANKYNLPSSTINIKKYQELPNERDNIID